MTVTPQVNKTPIYFNQEQNEWRNVKTEEPVTFPKMRGKDKILNKIKLIMIEVRHIEKTGVGPDYPLSECTVEQLEEEVRRIILLGRVEALQWVLQDLWEDLRKVNGKELTKPENLRDSQKTS